MHIDLLIANQFENFHIGQKRNKLSGGGMSVFVNAIQSALMSNYKVNICTDHEQLTAPVCIVETCYFVSNIFAKDFWGAVEDRLHKFSLKKKELGFKTLLVCAELTPFRLPKKHLDLLVANIDVWSNTVDYLSDLVKSIDVLPHGYLCDCINPDLFRPGIKEMSVIGVGALKYIKNIDWIIEVFNLLEGTGVKRIYLGGSKLWSQEYRHEDYILVERMKKVTDVFEQECSSSQVAYYNAHAAFAVNNTWHDCSSRANEELLMSGVISIHGEHPLFKNRPGFSVKTPEQAVEVIKNLTEGFTRMPLQKLHDQAREWGLANVSQEVFQKQFEKLVRHIL